MSERGYIGPSSDRKGVSPKRPWRDLTQYQGGKYRLLIRKQCLHEGVLEETGFWHADISKQLAIRFTMVKSSPTSIAITFQVLSQYFQQSESKI